MKYVLYFEADKQIVEIDGADIVADEYVLSKDFLDSVPKDKEVWVNALYEDKPFRACILQVCISKNVIHVYIYIYIYIYIIYELQYGC